MMVTLAQRIADQSPEEILGMPFDERLVKDELAWMEYKRSQEYGKRYMRTNPQKNAVYCCPNVSFILAKDTTVANGLMNFEAQIPIQTYAKDATSDSHAVIEFPIDCDIGVVYLVRQARFQLRGVINIIDYIFPDGIMPRVWIEKIFNALNPRLIVRIADPGFTIKELMPRARQDAKFYSEILLDLNNQAKDKKFPDDPESLEALGEHNILHEKVHMLIRSLPAGDIPAGQDDLRKITFEEYERLIHADKEILTSTAGAKNIYKGLCRPVKVRQKLTEEMFCDRFAMYLYENNRKNSIYQSLFFSARVISEGDFAKFEKAWETSGDALQKFLTEFSVNYDEEMKNEIEQFASDPERIKGFVHELNNT